MTWEPRGKRRDHKFLVRVTAEERAEIEAEAARLDRTISDMVRRIMADYFRRTDESGGR